MSIYYRSVLVIWVNRGFLDPVCLLYKQLSHLSRLQSRWNKLETDWRKIKERWKVTDKWLCVSALVSVHHLSLYAHYTVQINFFIFGSLLVFPTTEIWVCWTHSFLSRWISKHWSRITMQTTVPTNKDVNLSLTWPDDIIQHGRNA